MTAIAPLPNMRFCAVALALSLAACAQPADEQAAAPPGQAAEKLHRQTTGESHIPAEFRALGTEPFWAVHTVSSGNGGIALRYSTPENSEGSAIAIEDELVETQMRRLSGMMGDQPFAIELTVAPCSDGMSDRNYPFTAQVTLGDQTLAGCARPMDG